MIRKFRIFCLFATVLPAWGQITPSGPPTQKRDLYFKKGELIVKDGVTMGIPRGYALIIGISRYKNLPEDKQLKYPEADAAMMYTTFINPEAGAFPAENVHRLVGAAATLGNIRHELEDWLPAVSKPDDRVVIYFAGHGFMWEGKAYLAPYDISRDDVPGTAYAMDRLSEVFGGRIQAKWRVLLTDACHSGAILPAADAQGIYQRLQNFNQSSVFSLTASRDREVSFEGPDWGGGHGVFTHYLKLGLDGEADANADGVVTADELAEYIHNNVRRDTNGQQNPTSERGRWDPNMLLAYNPSRLHPFVGEPPKFGTLVIEANMDGVEIFLDGKSQGVIDKQKPMQVDGIAPGVHQIQGVHMGWEPYGPEDEMVYPGQRTSVKVRITIPQRKNKAAIDLVEKGLAYYANGNEQNYMKAAGLCEQALQLDRTYSRAALCLGRTYHALFKPQKADQYFAKAIATHPDYLEARDSYGAALLDQGNFQTAVQQLNVSAQRDPADGVAHYLLCVAFTRIGAADKNADAFRQAVQEGRESVSLIPSKAEAHFWLAESLRMAGDWNGAEPEYNRYLQLSDFDSKIAGKINYYVLGYLIGRGKKTHPTLPDIWKDQRSLAYFGLCDCERNLRHYENAINDCETSLSYDPHDPFTHYAVGISFLGKYGSAKDDGLLLAARKHFTAVIALNSEMQEAALAKKDIEIIDKVQPSLAAVH